MIYEIMKTTVIIENLVGENSRKKVANILLASTAVRSIKIHPFNKSILIDCATHNAMEGLRLKLERLGFPITKDSSEILE